jgi:CRP-like cAMP-binding protein
MDQLFTKLERVTALSDDDRSGLLALFSDTHHFKKGGNILREGEQPEHLHVLIDGWAAQCVALVDGSRQTTALLKRLDHGVVALTPVTIGTARRERLIALLLDRPNVARAFWQTTLVDAAVLRSWLVNIAHRDSYRRIAHLMCELHTRLSCLGLVSGSTCVVPLTQQQLGNALGLTPVHVNRMLRRLRNEGLMEFRKRTLTLHNIAELQEVANFDSGYLHIRPD